MVTEAISEVPPSPVMLRGSDPASHVASSEAAPDPAMEAISGHFNLPVTATDATSELLTRAWRLHL